MKAAKGIIGIALAIAISLPATAENKWVIREYRILDRDGVSNARSDSENAIELSQVVNTGVLAHTLDPEQPGVLFTCSERAGLSVTFAMTGADFTDVQFLTGAKGAARAFYGEVTIGNSPPVKRQKFAYRRRLAIAHGIGSELAYRTIEAIYAGDPVTVEIPHVDRVTFSLPALDATLKAFVAECPAFES